MPAPPTASLLFELRTPIEIARALASSEFRSPSMAGHGQPVLLIPGLFASDRSLTGLAHYFKRAGFAPRHAGIACNIDCSEAQVVRLAARLRRAVQQTGQKAIIVGHSRGGKYGRVLAVRYPDLVSDLICLGSPLRHPLGRIHPALALSLEVMATLGDYGMPGVASHDCLTRQAAREVAALGEVTLPEPLRTILVRRATENGKWASCCEAFWDDLVAPLPEHIREMSIYSRTDGVVHWSATDDPDADCHVEVPGSHCGMALSVPVMEAIAEFIGDR